MSHKRLPAVLVVIALALVGASGCGTSDPKAEASSDRAAGDPAGGGDSDPDETNTDGEIRTVCDVLTPAEVEAATGVAMEELREVGSYSFGMATMCEYLPPGADPEGGGVGIRMELESNEPGSDAFVAMPAPLPGLLDDPDAKASVIGYELRIQKAGQILNIFLSGGDLSREEREAALVTLGDAAAGRLPHPAVPVGAEADEGDETGEGASDSVDPDAVCPKVPYSVIDTVGPDPATTMQGFELSGDIRGTNCVYLSDDGIAQAELVLQPTAGADGLADIQRRIESSGTETEPVPELGDGAFTLTGLHGRREVAALDEERKLLRVTVYEVDLAAAVEFWKAAADIL